MLVHRLSNPERLDAACKPQGEQVHGIGGPVCLSKFAVGKEYAGWAVILYNPQAPLKGGRQTVEALPFLGRSKFFSKPLNLISRIGEQQ
jgi:hypothetical protein